MVLPPWTILSFSSKASLDVLNFRNEAMLLPAMLLEPCLTFWMCEAMLLPAISRCVELSQWSHVATGHFELLKLRTSEWSHAVASQMELSEWSTVVASQFQLFLFWYHFGSNSSYNKYLTIIPFPVGSHFCLVAFYLCLTTVWWETVILLGGHGLFYLFGRGFIFEGKWNPSRYFVQSLSDMCNLVLPLLDS